MVQPACAFAEEVVDNGVITPPLVSQELDNFLVDHRGVNKGHFPAERTRLFIPVRENSEDSLVDRLVVAVLLHVVGVYRTDCMVGSYTCRNN